MTTTISHTAVHLALRVRLQTVSGLPSLASENKAFTPTTGRTYVEEALVPASQSLIGLTTSGPCEWDGLYVVTLHGLANTGLAVSTLADSILAKFTPGLTLTSTNNETIRIRGTPAPWRGQVLTADGWAVCTITIPYWILA